MWTKAFRIAALCILLAVVGPVLAQDTSSKEAKQEEGRMMWAAMVGSGFLHEHMQYMIQQMASMNKAMAQMLASGKMNQKDMTRLSKMMTDMSAMMQEIPAIERMSEKQPALAMKDMSQMMKTMSELMAQMGQMMAEMPK